ncbi:oxygenase MpaB family protein [Sphingomonas sp. HMP9]|uniref:oxygenase MpaB family protein n=1 Tax=Sphingomonas sp. HMP9 TaxID=1517554 RepID=UPI001596B23E|nr:oxygenase MpaB family protein [Sphingomonas sp. HMP9]
MNHDLSSIRDQTKIGIVRQVQTLFNDQARGEEPVKRSDHALFLPDSMIWRVHGDVVSMMVGGVSALLLQMLHPAVLAGVWDHSNFRTDMLGRLRRTVRFIAATTYGERTEAEAAITRVRAVHAHIGGALPDGTRYRADDPALLAWVHVSEAWSFLAAWQQYGDRRLTRAQEDLYYAEFANIGAALGADSLPRNRAGTHHALRAMQPALVANGRTREVARLVLDQAPNSPLAIPLQRIAVQAAVDLLPDWARRMHGLSASPILMKPVIRSGTRQMAKTLRWAFNSN